MTGYHVNNEHPTERAVVRVLTDIPSFHLPLKEQLMLLGVRDTRVLYWPYTAPTGWPLTARCIETNIISLCRLSWITSYFEFS